MRPAIYIPTFDGRERLARALRCLEGQSRPADVVVVDNGSGDGTAAMVRDEFPEVELLELGRNLGFGPALNRAVAERPADPLILLNNDAEAEPRFVEALLDAAAEGAECVAGVLTQQAAPGLIDSAGVVADRTLMGFDYLHGEPLEAAASAAAPLGPTGGAALYRLTPSAPSTASTSASSSTTRTSTWRCACAPPAGAASRRPTRAPYTPTRPASAPAAPRSTPAPAGAAATCCAATASCAIRASPCGCSPWRERSAPASCCATAPRRGSEDGCAAGGTAAASERRPIPEEALLDLSLREALALRRRRRS